MKISGFPTLLLLMFVSASVWGNNVRIFSISADEWERPRSGQSMPRFESLRSAVSYWEKGLDARILISYPGEDSGEIWAAELKSWLVTLGIPSDRILMLAGSRVDDEIRLLVGNREELLQ